MIKIDTSAKIKLPEGTKDHGKNVLLGQKFCLLVTRGPPKLNFTCEWYLFVYFCEGLNFFLPIFLSPDTMRVTVERRRSPHWRLFDVIFLAFHSHFSLNNPCQCHFFCFSLFDTCHILYCLIFHILADRCNFFSFYFLAR